MEFRDFADRPGANHDDERGVHFLTEDASWKVCASDRGPTPFEWCIWQRAVPGDSRPHSMGYVRRLAWARFTNREEAQVMAEVLDDLPATGAIAVLRHAMRTRLRDMRRDVLVRLLAAVAEMAKRAREQGAPAVDPLLE